MAEFSEEEEDLEGELEENFVSNFHNVMGETGNLPSKYQQKYIFRKKQLKRKKHYKIKNDSSDNIEEILNWWARPLKPNQILTPLPNLSKIMNGKAKSVKQVSQQRQNNRKIKTTQDNYLKKAEQITASPYVEVRHKSLPIFSICISIMLIVVYIASLVLNKGFESPKKNNLIGTSARTLVSMGAKYGPFIRSHSFWRIFTAIFIEPGLVSLTIDVILILLLSSIEKTAGIYRAMFSFIYCGMIGMIVSCFFEPGTVQCGPSGAICGWISISLIDTILERKYLHSLAKPISIIVFGYMFEFFIGLHPYIDNFSNLTSLITGPMMVVVYLPFQKTGMWAKFARWSPLFFLPLLATSFIIMVVLFIRLDFSDWCTNCRVINCMTFSGICPPGATDFN